MKSNGLALAAIVVIALSAGYESRAQNTEPAAPTAPPAPAHAPPASAPAPTPHVQPPPAAAANNAPAPAKESPGQRCVQHSSMEQAIKEVSTELKSSARRTGPTLVSSSYFMPAGASFRVAINEQFKPEYRYFGYVEPWADRDNLKYVNMHGFIESGQIGAVRISDDDALVKSNLVDQGATLLTLQVPDSIGGFLEPGGAVYLEMFQ